MREHRLPYADPELAAQAQRLAQRVRALTQTRNDAGDTAASELLRIERDLHDGGAGPAGGARDEPAGGRTPLRHQPGGGVRVGHRAKETSSRALTELRDLVRGIYPPVLADRALGDAIQALALDTPLHTELDIDLPGEVEMPVASAIYFSVAEAIANVTKHAAARSVHIQLSHAAGMLPAEVTDDGAGGADPPSGPGWPEWNAGSPRLMASWR